MRTSLRLLIALSLTIAACKGPGAGGSRDTPQAQRQAADSPATASSARAPTPADSASRVAKGIEPGSIPATPTPTVTTESSIAAMRLHLQRLDTASLQNLQANMKDHAKKLGDLLTTMGVEVQAVTSPAKTSWLALSDTVDGDLDRLSLAAGEELRTTFRAHRSRVVRLLDEFRVLIPAKSPA